MHYRGGKCRAHGFTMESKDSRGRESVVEKSAQIVQTTSVVYIHEYEFQNSRPCL
jgi:hypothetical protein